MRVGYISSESECPAGLEALTAGGRKLCRKTVDIGCSSVTFPTHGVSYSKVCGRVYGYQKETTDGFQRHSHCPGCTIDKQYVDGVSITHGSPRQHIWTLATTFHGPYCRCDDTPFIPPFVGNDYFCDGEGTNTFTLNDRLWDGHSCLCKKVRNVVTEPTGSVRTYRCLLLMTLSSGSAQMKSGPMKTCRSKMLRYTCSERNTL